MNTQHTMGKNGIRTKGENLIEKKEFQTLLEGIELKKHTPSEDKKEFSYPINFKEYHIVGYSYTKNGDDTKEQGELFREFVRRYFPNSSIDFIYDEASRKNRPFSKRKYYQKLKQDMRSPERPYDIFLISDFQHFSMRYQEYIIELNTISDEHIQIIHVAEILKEKSH